MIIFKLVIGLLVVYLLFKGLKVWRRPGIDPKSTRVDLPGEDLVEDPFCHAYLPVSQAIRIELNGNMIYFCSQDCLDRYKKQQNVKG